jgi:hypothetical protein
VEGPSGCGRPGVQPAAALLPPPPDEEDDDVLPVDSFDGDGDGDDGEDDEVEDESEDESEDAALFAVSLEEPDRLSVR